MKKGLLSGLVSGYVFLAYAGPAVHDMTGGIFATESVAGFVLHGVFSIVIGALYTGLFFNYLDFGNSLLNILIGGSIYGLFWWIVGSNIIVPVLTGGQILQLSLGPSFYGHMIFGHMLAFMVIGGYAETDLDWEYIDGNEYKTLPKLNHPAGYVYNAFNEKTNLTKIGRTIDPEQRLRHLRQDHGKQLEYKSLRKSDNAPKDENRLHKKYDSRRKDGEWFDMD